MIAENIAAIQARIREAALRANRDPEQVRIVAAAKTQSIEKVREAIDAGIHIIGHNYVQEAEAQALIKEEAHVEFHMIGHLQKNKAGKAVTLFDLVETVDNEKIASALDRRAGSEGRVIGVMIQVSLAGETQKSGVERADIEQLIQAIRGMPHLKLKGLMTMPPFFDQPERARPYFAQLRELRDQLIDSGSLTREMSELSMGMTGDFEVAVEEGSTLVRIGTALFGPRT
jgi:pyridoxal phosphate enzyme (YggS family)